MKADDVWTKWNIPFVVLKFKGVWDPDKLYSNVLDWFARRKWEYQEPAVEHGPDTGFGETNYFEIGAERKEDEWVKYTLKAAFWFFNEKTIDADGKKLSSGRIQIHFQGNLEMDYEKKWNKSIFTAALKDFYNKYLIRRRLAEKYWDKLWYELHNLHAHVKDSLNMQARSYEHKHAVGVRRG